MRFAGFGNIEERAQGTRIYDLAGNEYIDCLGGYGVFSLGHCHPKVVEAVRAQVGKLPLSTKIFFNKPLADLCAKLASVTPGPLQYSFVCNSGTEAVEGAIKVARMYTGRRNFVATVGGFHGKSMGSLSASGRELFKTPFTPLVPGFSHVPFGDIQALESASDGETAAVIVEPVQGEGGIRIPPAGYLKAVRQLCDERGILMIADEVQTGFGRTGRMFGVDHEGISPDIMTMAKALGGGVMPIGAFSATPAVWEASFGQNPLIHTTTFGGNPLACVAALAAIEVFEEENLPARAADTGAYFLEKLRGAHARYPQAISEVRGIGLMIGTEFEVEDIGELVIGGMARRGVVAAYTLNNPRVIRFEPPLIITREEIDVVVQAFDEAVAEALEMLEGLV
ncbi:MAG: aminotransferase class III-fold pyridoxal phosphate-dependent enzyme [Armatimonadetes bacterium]|nr:aminotransferase class III-fold pyridoxal phosphate-dependent enzyme [Armatimonadota bacterium]